jgi:hypothetical protein
MEATMIVRVKANVPWQVRTVRNEAWLAVCDPLKLTVEASTYGELMGSISETLDAVLVDLLSSNELPQFLQSHGWALMSPIPGTATDVRFDVPFIPAMITTNDPQGIIHQ